MSIGGEEYSIPNAIINGSPIHLFHILDINRLKQEQIK